MLAKADVFIQNLKPGAIAKLGFPIARLRKDYPSLICCSISGFGETGPYATRKSYDLLVQAEAGLASVTGGPEAPARVGVSVMDVASGMNAYEAVLEAIIARGRTGAGRGDFGLDVRRDGGLDDGAAAAARGRQIAEAPRPRASSISPYGVFKTKRRRGHPHLDPERSRVADSRRKVMDDKRSTDDPKFAKLVDRVTHRAETDRQVAAAFATHGRRHVIEEAREAPISRSRA